MLHAKEKKKLKRELREELEKKLLNNFETSTRGDRKPDRRKVQLIDVIRKLRQ